MKQTTKILLLFFAIVIVTILGAYELKVLSPLYLWYLTRASAITSYIMLFLLTMSGMGGA